MGRMGIYRNSLTALKALVATAAALLLTATATQAAPADAPARTEADWQEMARADLEATHALVLSAHPGAIDELNPGFKEWTETGYRKALALVPRAISYDTAMAVVRYYVAGFRDGHFSYSDNARKGYPAYVNGWVVERVNGDYIVRKDWPHWPTPLPPAGARLIECDGRAPDAIVREDAAPYLDGRDLPAMLDMATDSMTMLKLSGLTLKRCRFKDPAGETIDIDVSYHMVTNDELFAVMADASRQPARHNGYTLDDGVLWIRAGNFNLQPGTEDGPELEALVAALPALKGVRQIVFDTRGNGGGDSSVGARIFNAATGGYDIPDMAYIRQLPRTYAEWRASDVSIDFIAAGLERKTALYGAQSGAVKQLQELSAQLKAAKAAGLPWVRQDGGYRIAAADFTRAHGHMRRFDGKVVLVTDYHCASACLDFADLVLLAPGATHLGQTTSSDSVYLEAAGTRLPSGNQLFLPMKVWRNRVRGNNETLAPQVPLTVDMRDDDAVRAATLAWLKSAPPSAAPQPGQGH